MSEKVDVSISVCVRCGRVSMNGNVCTPCQQREESYAEHNRLVESGLIGDRPCVDCGKTIPHERLEAVPECLRCVNCQTAHETKHKDERLAGVMVYDGKTGGSIMFVPAGEHRKWKDRWR